MSRTPALDRARSLPLSGWLEELPAPANEFYSINSGWTPTIKTFLKGIRSPTSTNGNDDNENGENIKAQVFPPCVLTLLRDHEDTLVRHIFSFVTSPFARHLRITIPAPFVETACKSRLIDYEKSSSSHDEGYVAFAPIGQVTFPEPADRNVNMMPFIFGDMDSLPDNVKGYFEMIECCPCSQTERGKIGYLTVQESFVEKGQTQRRGGLHIEAPGTFISHVDNDATTTSSVSIVKTDSWGGGRCYGLDGYEGGIYVASSIGDTTCIWDALVDNRIPNIVDDHGGCEHLRAILDGYCGDPNDGIAVPYGTTDGNGNNLMSCELIWMTDRTPHEALPMPYTGYRQFFRVVTPNITRWYKHDNTVNPNIPTLPDHVEIVHGSKFVSK